MCTCSGIGRGPCRCVHNAEDRGNVLIHFLQLPFRETAARVTGPKVSVISGHDREARAKRTRELARTAAHDREHDLDDRLPHLSIVGVVDETRRAAGDIDEEVAVGRRRFTQNTDAQQYLHVVVERVRGLVENSRELTHRAGTFGLERVGNILPRNRSQCADLPRLPDVQAVEF